MRLFALMLCACSPELTASPSHGSLFGQYSVTFSGDFHGLGAVHGATLAGVAAYDLTLSDARHVSLTVQGALDPGDADLTLLGVNATKTFKRAFHYDAARVPASQWAAFGASLTQGVQSNGIDPHSQINNVSGQLARAAGVWLALPLFSPGVVPALSPNDIPADCAPAGVVAPSIGAIVQALTAPDGSVDLSLARIDQSLATRNFAVGGSLFNDIMRGAAFPESIIEHVVDDPMLTLAAMLNPETTSQIDRLEKLDPDLAFCADLLGNDAANAVLHSDVAASRMTPLTTITPLLAELARRLGALHGQFFIANVFDMTKLPHVAQLQAASTDAPDVFAAKVAAVDTQVAAYNQALVAAFAAYANLHLVDVFTLTDTAAQGIDVGGEHLTLAHLGGLLSLDDFHFTDTGYAYLANAFIAAINQATSRTIPAIDLVAVHATDALSPSALRPAHACVP